MLMGYCASSRCRLLLRCCAGSGYIFGGCLSFFGSLSC